MSNSVKARCRCAFASILIAAILPAQENAPEQAAAPPSDGVWRFDFGTPKSDCQRDYVQVLPDTEYTAERRFGYTGKRPTPKAFDQNRRIIRDSLALDDVTRDGIYGGSPFRIDVEPGSYRVVVLTGQYSRPGANRPDSHFREYSIQANGQMLYAQKDDVETFFAPDGRYFHNYYRDWHPDVNLYRENISRWIPFGQADVEVTDGKLEVVTSAYAPINALWVFPEDSQAGHAVVQQFRQQQESFFNDQYPHLPEDPQFPLTDLPANVRSRGALVYVRTNAQLLRPHTRPVSWDIGRPLRLWASLGEREAGVVAVTPLRDLDGEIDLAVSDLQGADGARIAASAFDIRTIRYGEYPTTGGYAVKPHFLVPWRPKRMEVGITRGFWIDLHVPADAVPGFYQGMLTFAASGVKETLPVKVRILPLTLPMSRLYAGVYAGGLTSTTFRHFRTMRKLPYELMKQVLRARMQFYTECGFTGLFDSLPWYPFDLEDGKVVPREEWEWYLEVFRAAASFPNFRERIFCYYLGGAQMFPKCPHYLRLTKADKMELDDIRFPDEAVAEMTAMVQELYKRVRAEGLPELTFYVFDELGNHGAKGARWGREMLKTLNRCRDAVPGGFRTCVSTLRSSVAREYLPHADIVMPNRAYPLTDETIAEIREHGGTLGLYNLAASRFSYGFYPWRVKAYTRAQWSFSYDGDSRDPFVSLPSGARGSCDCHFTPDWEVLPSIGMLIQREGVDDYRYIQLLEEQLGNARTRGKGEAPAATQAQAVLEDLTSAVQVTYLDPENNWDKSTMDYWRWRVAEAAMQLQAALR